jgi:glycosyltransferase involved in cell wall biosynthesis
MIHSPTRPGGKVLFLVSPSTTPCGVEMFARGLATSSRALGVDARCHTLAGRLREMPGLWRATDGISALIVNLPIVAWKRALLAPAVSLIVAKLRSAQTIVLMHEWADLDWRRRLVIAFYLLLTQTVLFSSPIVRAQFERSLIGWLPLAKGLIPIPPNIKRPPKLSSTALTERLVAERAKGRKILGHFGSIYPKKRSTFVLDIAAELKRSHTDVFVVFVGSFIRGVESVEAEFRARATALDLDDDILVTGYIESAAEIFAVFDCVDTFVYSFAEGLSSRRGSVLACLQSGRQVVVNAPAESGEFAHHPAFLEAIARPILQMVPTNANSGDFAGAIKSAGSFPASEPLRIFEDSWRDAAFAVRSAVTLWPGTLESERSLFSKRAGDAMLTAKIREFFDIAS